MTLPCASVLLASSFICSRRRREASKIDDGGDELLDDGEAFNIIMMVAVVERGNSQFHGSQALLWKMR